MCDCASCSYTDEFAGAPDLLGLMGDGPSLKDTGGRHVLGFDCWPRGEPAGPGASRAAYTAHVRACPPIAKPYKVPKFGPPPSPDRSDWVKRMPASFYAWLNRDWDGKKASPAVAEPARPAPPSKAEQHLPARDRPRESARIYAMPKAKLKRPIGRPAMPGRRVVIKLAEELIKRAAKLGEGNVAAGIRRALSGPS